MPDRVCCLECDDLQSHEALNVPTVSRRQFVQTHGVTDIASAGLPRILKPNESKTVGVSQPRSLVKKRHGSLSERPRRSVRFSRDQNDGGLGQRTRASNHLRLKDLSCVGHSRGTPPAHVWVNLSDAPSVPTNAAG
jgi:hypothetical protein